MAPKMQRVLIVDQQVPAARMLTELLRDIALCQVWTALDAAQGMALAQSINPHLIFVEQNPTLDGAAFTRALRRSHFTCRKAPVIMVTAEATASAIVAARDAGVHEFLRRPFTLADLMRRIEAVTLRSRSWVEGVGYIGPDRRRFNIGDYTGPLKRGADSPATSDAARISQALKIFRTAVFAIEAQPQQAMRALLAQVEELLSAGASMNDIQLCDAAALVQCSLTGAEALKRRDLESHLAALWRFMPGDAETTAVAA